MRWLCVQGPEIGSGIDKRGETAQRIYISGSQGCESFKLIN